uniref:Uncharacterized protein n=1 Tax=Arundo donax TaxID=35708 RepID=A0A0A9F4J7_ARUDO
MKMNFCPKIQLQLGRNR